MRTLLGLLAAVWLAAPLSAADIAAEDLELFFELIAIGLLTAVEATLSDTPTIATARDPDGFAPIHMLDYADFDAKLALLLAHGADINTQNADGIALIHILIDPDFLPAVLAAGANINLPDTEGRTPLMLFAQEPEGADMVRALLAAGADAGLRDAQGHSVMYYASESGQDQDLLDDLQSAGAPPG